MRLDDICLVNAEVTASDDFYREGVGLTRRMRNVRFADFVIGDGPRLAMWMRPSIAETVGAAYPRTPGLPFRICLELSDQAAVEAAAARIPNSVRLSGSPASPRATAPGALASYAVTDPDGFVLTLQPSPTGRERIASIELAVSDVARSYDFLERLGFTAAPTTDGRTRFDGGGVTLILIDVATLPTLGLSEYATYAHRGGHLMLALELETGAEVDELHSELVARGLTDAGAPAVYEWGARSAYFVDPDGYIWEIYAWVDTPS